MSKKYPQGSTNSLKNLAPLFTEENAKEMQAKSAASRKATRKHERHSRCLLKSLRR